MQVIPGRLSILGGQSQEFVASPAQPVGWSLARGHGVVTEGAGLDTATYESPNRTGSDTLRAVSISGGEHVDIAIEVVGVFPLVPSYPAASGAAKDARVNALQGGGRIAAPASGAYLKFALSGNEATADEITALAEFHGWHHPALSFYVRDYRTDTLILCKFDGDLEWRQTSFDAFEWSVPIRSFSFSAGFGGDPNSPFGA
jgi:hypothetical protein